MTRQNRGQTHVPIEVGNSEPPPAPAPSSDRSGRDYPLPTTRYSLLLISYFRSGWAFLIPYLAAYLLYAWLRWPVNPGGAGEGIVKGISESVEAPRSPMVSPSFLQRPRLSLPFKHKNDFTRQH